jgi:hypothetical protein
MRKALLLGLSAAVVLALAACGSDGGSTGAPAGTSPNTSTTFAFDNARWVKAGPNPSESAEMVCSQEARDDIDASLGIKTKKITKPTWVRKDHIYSCDYVFSGGKIRLEVKEMSSGDETTAYFEQIKARDNAVQELKGLGQGAWVLENGNVLVRKDYKTLIVDVADAPEIPAMRRSDVAINVASVIMSCWTGY